MLPFECRIVKFGVGEALLDVKTGGSKTALHPLGGPLNSRLFNTGKA